jgi:hypothetical protein
MPSRWKQRRISLGIIEKGRIDAIIVDMMIRILLN